MSEILLAKPKLPSDWLDCSVGEAHVVREALYSVFDIDNYCMQSHPRMDYPFPTGYEPLVQLLEDKYQAPVVITNGAKQGLSAAFFALQQMGNKTIAMCSPHWALIPPLLEKYGLDFMPPDTWYYHNDSVAYDSYLCVAPNNPTGAMPNLQSLDDFMKERGIPFIHDSVYYSHVYLPPSHPLKQYGDVQIYSASKAFGCSGLRLGWTICHNHEFYKLIQAYMEMMTVGVSVLSQVFIYELMTHMNAQPQMTKLFEQTASAALTRSKQIIKEVSPDILEVPDNMEEIPGMFAFLRCHKPKAFAEAKVNPAWGEPFGAPGFVRINLALPEDQMVEVVKRLNSVNK